MQHVAVVQTNSRIMNRRTQFHKKVADFGHESIYVQC
jgi:hypothetical protein